VKSSLANLPDVNLSDDVDIGLSGALPQLHSQAISRHKHISFSKQPFSWNCLNLGGRIK